MAMTPTRIRMMLLAAAMSIAMAAPALCQVHDEVARTFTPAVGAAMARLAPAPAAVPDERTEALSLGMAEARHKGLLGLAIGGVGLGLVGGLLGHALCSRYSSDPNDSCTGETLVGAGIGAALGAGLGFLIGKQSKRSP